MLRCKKCRRSVKHHVLIVIDDTPYCKKCLRYIKTRDTGERGSYYTNVGPRIFVEFPNKISEYRLDELKIGTRW